MFETITSRRQKSAQHETAAQQPEQSPGDLIATINERVGVLRAEHSRLMAEALRLRELAHQHDGGAVASASAEQFAISLHARRAAGETVDDAELAAAEALNVNTAAISYVISGKKPSVKGYKIRFAK